MRAETGIQMNRNGHTTSRIIQRSNGSKRAFTLIELVVVILILAILAAMIVPKIVTRTGDAKRARALQDIAVLGSALDQFHIDNDRYPSTQEGLSALSTAPADAPNWRGPYLKKSVGSDPWGNDYDYQLVDEKSYSLKSYGSDLAPGGEGDAEDISENDEENQE
jgi:general secretion pathway protein G